jgi:hypothetical protein
VWVLLTRRIRERVVRDDPAPISFLHFLSPASRPSHVGLSPSLRERVVLPTLTHFKFRGASEYLNSLVTRIDTPGLVHVEVRFFNQLIFHLSQLGQFIDRIDVQKSHRRADIVFSGRAVSITFTQPGAPARLTLQISCEPLDWQLSSMAQMCDHLSHSYPVYKIYASIPPNDHLRRMTWMVTNGWSLCAHSTAQKTFM